MIVEITPQKIVKGATTVWNEHGDDVDIVMDPKNLQFKPGSISEIYSFHVLERLFIDEIMKALVNWKNCLADNGKLFLVVDDIEYIARAYVGGDINAAIFNQNFSHPTHFDRDLLTSLLAKIGFREDDMTIWFESVNNHVKRQPHELVICAQKQKHGTI